MAATSWQELYFKISDHGETTSGKLWGFEVELRAGKKDKLGSIYKQLRPHSVRQPEFKVYDGEQIANLVKRMQASQDGPVTAFAGLVSEEQAAKKLQNNQAFLQHFPRKHCRHFIMHRGSPTDTKRIYV